MWTKSCPKCKGDLFWEKYLSDVPELTCLQCGFSLPADKASAPGLTRRSFEAGRITAKAA